MKLVLGFVLIHINISLFSQVVTNLSSGQIFNSKNDLFIENYIGTFAISYYSNTIHNLQEGLFHYPVRKLPTPTEPNNQTQLFEVVTPNNDNKNDFLVFENPKKLTHKLEIYNAFGNLIFTSEDYKNNWCGESVDAGQYYYLLQLPDQSIQGTLILVK